MKKCILKSDLKAAEWYENEINKMDNRILALRIAKPALRALINASIFSVETLRNTPVHVLKELHGMGPSTINKLNQLR